MIVSINIFAKNGMFYISVWPLAISKMRSICLNSAKKSTTADA